MRRDDWKWALGCLGALVLVIAIPLWLLLGPLHSASGGARQLGAILVFVGVLVTATVSIIGYVITRQSNRRLQQEDEDDERRLRLEAAMRAGALFSPSGPEPVDPASIASSLLALTKLDHAELAVALLVDFWSTGPVSAESGSEVTPTKPGPERVSTETAILVIDAALRTQTQPNARLVAAELLCRNASRLDACQSLNWPSAIDGCWDPGFGPKTKLLLVEALINMTLTGDVTENALRSVAVRLYGIWKAEKDDARVRGCVGKLISALTPKLASLGYADFMQGNQMVMLSQLEEAANSAKHNPDGFLDRIVDDRYKRLQEWAASCTTQSLDSRKGALADAA